jgi:hypothetical protein
MKFVILGEGKTKVYFSKNLNKKYKKIILCVFIQIRLTKYEMTEDYPIKYY